MKKWFPYTLMFGGLVAAFLLGRYYLPSSDNPTDEQPTTSTTAESTVQQVVASNVTPTSKTTQTDASAKQSTSTCPTTEEAKNLTGVDVQRLATEPCAFVWRGTPPATVVATCPTGWVCTWDVVNDIVVVHLGVNQKAEIHAGTWRFIAGYPPNDAVHDVCALYQKEKNFGLTEVPSFQVRFQPVTDGTHGPVGPQTCSDN